jgi:hypothetical protein
MSGNTFGAELWTDFKCDAHMWPLQIPLSRCHSCGGFYWAEEAEKLGHLDENAPKEWKNLPRPCNISLADLYDALREGVFRDREEEVELRMFAWWYGNDPYRPKNYWVRIILLFVAVFLVVGAVLLWEPIGSILLAFLAALLFSEICCELPQAFKMVLLGKKRAQRSILNRQLADNSFQQNLQALYSLLDPDDPEQRLRKAEAARELGFFSETNSLLEHALAEEGQRRAADIIRDLASREDRLVRLLWRM